MNCMRCSLYENTSTKAYKSLQSIVMHLIAKFTNLVNNVYDLTTFFWCEQSHKYSNLMTSYIFAIKKEIQLIVRYICNILY